jgi:Ca2+-binding EF-hand superfamily protein
VSAAIPRGAAPTSQPPRAATRGIWDQYGLNQEEYDHIFAVFMTFDTDDSGELSRPELTQLCRYLNFATNPRDIDAMFAQMDTDRSGRLSMDEFSRWLGSHRPDPRALYGLTEEQYRQVLFQFHTYDRDNDGELDEREFSQLAIRMAYARNPPEASALFHQIDLDRNRRINLHELLTFRFSRLRQQQPQAPAPAGGGYQYQAPPPQPQQQQQPQAYYQQQPYGLPPYGQPPR